MSKRLHWLQDKPIGTIYEKWSDLHRIKIVKESSSIVRMYFVDPHSLHPNPASSGAMSAIDLNDPFDLSPTPYNQAMMLSLLWNANPERVYMIGLAGGRIPLVLHHYFPELTIESTDIDAETLVLARRFFGFEPDHRQSAVIMDGRDYLESRAENVCYDFIFVDAFRGTGFSPLHLASADFYQRCKKHLNAQGVVLFNMIESDPLFLRKINTIQNAFRHVYLLLERTIVVFGTDIPLDWAEETVSKATALQEKYQFPFSLVSRAKTLKPLSECGKFLGNFVGNDATITDKNLESALRETVSANDPIFYNAERNGPCPCGSRKKYKKCHGRL
ncbi:MAG: fused MFS/spermidine synthase [SAR324 cluster bacterium]|nr:fused MFS/spermidine synthase [SAR324 cluster bacterium]